ncbi:GTP-binding protein REM 2-like, partial [Heptranchias perlo]|uniref:GTP-binding protein REM 2-like n=1 Tax=Heptranchias perlo TaxID=212740 RepID=UPI00355A6769
TEDRYERTLTVDEEEVTLVVYDIWEQEGASDWVQENCLELGDAYIIAFSVTDRVSFQRADELRAKLQATRPSQDIPIILVGNKTDLVRSREVTVEDARSRAASVDCKYIETSAALRHNTRELFEGVVRQLRLRLSGRGGRGGGRRESLTERAKRFLRSLVGGNYRGIFRQRSKSCHDLSVL